MPCPLNICFTNKVNTICGGRQLLVTGSQCPIARMPGVRIQCPRVGSPKAQGPKSQGPGSQSLGSQGLGSPVSSSDFRLCPLSMRLFALNFFLRTEAAAGGNL